MATDTPATGTSQVDDAMPLLLWPGLAADARLFEALLGPMPNARAPAFIGPERGETLRAYARRYAATLDVPEDGRYAVGGFSFGGQLALELAAVLEPRPRGVVLIVGVRGKEQILPAFKRQRRAGALVPRTIARRIYPWYARRFAARDGLGARETETLVAMARDIDPAFLDWSSRACVGWEGPPGLDGIPVRHIHGELDRVIPDVNKRADEVIAGAGHLITLTRADEVTDFVLRSLAGFERSA